MIRVAAALRASRIKAGLSQAQVAERIGLSQQHVSAIERHAAEPFFGTVLLVAEALGLSVDAMIADDYQPPAAPPFRAKRGTAPKPRRRRPRVLEPVQVLEPARAD